MNEENVVRVNMGNRGRGRTGSWCFLLEHVAHCALGIVEMSVELVASDVTPLLNRSSDILSTKRVFVNGVYGKCW
jgi:hypothetical protein